MEEDCSLGEVYYGWVRVRYFFIYFSLYFVRLVCLVFRVRSEDGVVGVNYIVLIVFY